LKKITFIFGLLCFAFYFHAQVIYNAYAAVNSISGTTFSINTSNETNHTFVNGEQVIIMQMQDNVIGTNTLNTVAFGSSVSSIQRTGLWEVKTIQSQTRTGGILQSLTFSTPLANTYTTGTNSSLQVITFRRLSLAAFTTTNNITALAWDGNIGGVVAIEIGTTLNLAHSISANGLGFRGGNRSNNYYGGGTTCTLIDYITSSANSAFKGEGIYKSTNANFTNGIARVISGGGGGGQDINGGGGGGSNFTAGGIGGIGWNGSAAGCPIATSPRGLGGIALSSFILPSRIFMGGGGGGGQQNDGLGTSGGSGGGIVIVKANTLATSGTCGSALRISANGNSAASAGNDGAGGGGAAGTVVLQIANYTVAPTCSINISSNGGNGGTVNSTTHAGGGAGGQGVIIFSTAQPTTNVSATTTNGTAGCDNSNLPCTSFAGSASGTNNSGIFSGINGALPVHWIQFNANLYDKNRTLIEWQLVNEGATDYYELEHSTDGLTWTILLHNKTNGKSQPMIAQSYIHAPIKNGTQYYRLKAVDENSRTSYTTVRSVFLVESFLTETTLSPNPTTGDVQLCPFYNSLNWVMYDVAGRNISDRITSYYSDDCLHFHLSSLAKGIYFLQAMDSNGTILFNKKVVKE
jgi:hypothetical protein